MQHFFFPTAKNNYRAWLLKTPVLAVFTLIVFLVNTATGIFPVQKVYAAINTNNLLELHNQERAKDGLTPLVINSTLNYSAQLKAQAMLDSDCWSHYCPDGKSPWDFFDQAGYDYIYAGENLAEGFYNDEDVMNAWMNSPSHKDNILKPEYREVGFGIVTGNFQGIDNNVIIVVHFGTQQSQVHAQQQTNQSVLKLDAPTITYPTDQAKLNKTEFDIVGNAPDASQVDITKNGQNWGTADANQGTFTYRAAGLVEGNYTISATSRASGTTSEPSANVNFSIDVTPNPTLQDAIVVNSIDENSMLNIAIHQENLKSLVITVNGKQYDLIVGQNNLWSTSIVNTDFSASNQFKITNTDDYGNEWTGNINSSIVLDQADQLIPSREVAVTAFGKISKSAIDFVFLLILILLFGIDFITLARTGITRKGSKSHLHFAIMLIIGLIAITGTFAGVIGTGIGS